MTKGQGSTELTEWEEHLEREITDSTNLKDTERTVLVRAPKWLKAELRSYFSWFGNFYEYGN